VGSVVFGVSVCCSVCRDFGDGCAGGGFVDDGVVGGERGDEGLQGEVVDRAGMAPAGPMDERDSVVGEQRVLASGQLQVVAQVAAGFGLGHGRHRVAQPDAPRRRSWPLRGRRNTTVVSYSGRAIPEIRVMLPSHQTVAIATIYSIPRGTAFAQTDSKGQGDQTPARHLRAVFDDGLDLDEPPRTRTTQPVHDLVANQVHEEICGE
jgi:hypothetical protein